MPTQLKVLVPNLGIGNLASVCNMVRKCGGEPQVVSEPEGLEQGRRVILSGVGAFDAGMGVLRRGGWIEPLSNIARESRVPILGICLGMQLMCRRSEEGALPGLGWFDAEVKRISPPEASSLKVPHMGWNEIHVLNQCTLLPDLVEQQRFYFVHSYHVVCANSEEVVATTSYGGDLTAAIHKNQIYGVQFHPEKSHQFGMALIRRFLSV